MEQADLIWHNGELVAWEDAKVHVLTHGLHYGTGVFEGDARLRDAAGHRRSSATTITSTGCSSRPSCTTCRSRTRSRSCARATHELIAANELRECYIRPIAFRGYGQMGLYPLDAPVEVSIAVWPWGAYLGEEGKRDGIRAKVSSWRRISHDSLIPHAKASGQYLNSVLAKIEATKAGYEEAILLDHHGLRLRGLRREHLRRCATARSSRRRTPPGSSTGSAASRSSRSRSDLGYEVVERDIARAELYLADEVFLTGTAAELVPVREIDDHTIGSGEPGRDHTRDPARVRRRAARARPALRASGSTSSRCRRKAA